MTKLDQHTISFHSAFIFTLHVCLSLLLQIPFYPVVKKDLTFIHLGNDTKVEGLINFEKLRMIAKEVRSLGSMCSSPYDLLTMLELGGQPPSNAMVALNQMNAGPQQPATVKRRKKSTATPNPKKMFEEVICKPEKLNNLVISLLTLTKSI
jgi:hypothetical protein